MSEEELAVNLSIIDELDRKVTKAGGKLIVVDASLYFWFTGANGILTERIEDFCDKNRIAYIDLYKDLLKTDEDNVWARFTSDGHFNEHGNVIFAHRMLEWIKKNSSIQRAKARNN